MGESNTAPAPGVVLARGRTRAWVEQGALHWTRGRRTVVVPGTRIRRVEAAGKSLTVHLVEDARDPQDARAAPASRDARGSSAVRVRHRNADIVTALASEIEAIIGDAGPSGNRQPVQRHSRRIWPLRLAAGLRDRVLHGNHWWRRGLSYAVVGLPLAVALPVDPVGGFFAWLLLPAGFALLWLWVWMTQLNTRWVMWRRGVTVRARFETVLRAENYDPLAHFRTLDGREVAAHCAREERDEITYDPRDPSRVLAPARVNSWLGYTLGAFFLTGCWGVLLCVPAVIWLTRLLTLPF
ncbi:hypothetical protein ABT071_23345 [Streptomyces sp. NPDC002506]|uniref:hypothetical protein n=1 Tax=Streptomyces sp. NPDC002506 TaxID=3154536 RepID=UPI0033301807